MAVVDPHVERELLQNRFPSEAVTSCGTLRSGLREGVEEGRREEGSRIGEKVRERRREGKELRGGKVEGMVGRE